MAKGLLWLYIIFSFIAAFDYQNTNTEIPLEQTVMFSATLMVLAICESIEKRGAKK